MHGCGIWLFADLYSYFAVGGGNGSGALVVEAEGGAFGGDGAAGELGVEGVVKGEDTEGVVEEATAAGGEGDAGADAFEEGASGFGFELCNTLADSRLTDTEATRGFGDAAFLGHRCKSP